MALQAVTNTENTAASITINTSASEANSISVSQSPAASSKNQSSTTQIPVLAEVSDTVTLQNIKVTDINSQRLEKERSANKNKQTASEQRSVSDVLFAYNSRGDLRIKFMDSSNSVVYQTPPVMFARIADLMSKPQSSVDTTA